MYVCEYNTIPRMLSTMYPSTIKQNTVSLASVTMHKLLDLRTVLLGFTVLNNL